ncbi:MAG: hypothetical protein HY955_07730 [Deltaproteobacteria bacterium]|nr:hypothetical protein [Deltaproteobacteria bacterium]
MAYPSKTFTVITDSAVDADSPIDVSLMTSLRDNDVHLREWLGGDYAAESNHSHDGVNSRSISGGQTLLMDRDAMTVSLSFVTIDTVMLYIPADLTALAYCARTKVEFTGRADMRLKKGATDGTTVQGTPDETVYAWHGPGTIDVSALSGWQTFEVQLSHTTGSYNAYIDKAVGRMT